MSVVDRILPRSWSARVFLGTRGRQALLSLKDSAGKERARLSVGADEAARLEFLDSKGSVVASFP
jgi:hypothetical protein